MLREVSVPFSDGLRICVSVARTHIHTQQAHMHTMRKLSVSHTRAQAYGMHTMKKRK